MSKFILDASAILAFINEETGADIVADVLDDSTISAINLTEAYSKLIRAGADVEKTHAMLQQCCPDVTPVDRDQAQTAGIIHAATAKHNISYADSLCLALGACTEKTIMTGDQKWKELELEFDVNIKLIR